MPPDITAQDLMRPNFLRIGAGHTLREALGILLDPQTRRRGTTVLFVLRPEGTLAGVLTTRTLLRALIPDWAQQEPSEGIDIPAFEKRLLGEIQNQLDRRVTEAMATDFETALPSDRLAVLIERMQTKRLECMPVLESDRVVGVIYLTDVFNAAAQLALTSS